MADTHSEEIIAKVATDANVARICNMLTEKDFHLFVPALRANGNILTTNDSGIIDRCLRHTVLDRLTPLLFEPNSNIVKECCWALSNISAGT